MFEPARLKLFFHTGWRQLFVNGQQLKGKQGSLALYSVTGQLLRREEFSIQPPYYTPPSGPHRHGRRAVHRPGNGEGTGGGRVVVERLLPVCFVVLHGLHGQNGCSRKSPCKSATSAGIRVLLLLTTVRMLRLLTTVDTEECTEEHRDRAL